VRIRWLSPLLCCGFLWAAPPDGIERELDVRIHMRDGVELSANVFRPASAARLPAILVRTPYNNGVDLASAYRPFVLRGYAVVVQDVRGRYDSQGVFEPLRQEDADSEDTLNWIGRQSWSNRRIGMLGGSYLGIVQWKSALLENPYLKAIFPVVAGCDDYFDRFYSTGGALKLGQRLEWLSENLRAPGFPKPDFHHFVLNLPLRTSDRLATGHTVDFYQQALDHPAYDAFWKNLSTREKIERVHVPVFSVGGWYDNFVESDLEAFRLMRKNGRIHRLLIGPWPHNMSLDLPGANFGADAKVPILPLQLEWFDYWLKGAPEPAACTPSPIRRCGSSSWGPTAGGTRRNGRSAGPSPPSITWRAADACSAASQRATDRGYLSTTPRTRRPPTAERCAAIPRSLPGDRWISGRSRPGPMCWSTRALR